MVLHSEGATGRVRPMCHCKCDCGNEKFVRPTHLRDRKVKSCGCFKDENTSKRKAKPLPAGTTFHWLTVLGTAPKTRGETGCLKIRCECVCGKETIVDSVSLRNGNTKSCGCRRAVVSREKATTHGMAGSPTYRSWQDMVKRGTGKNRPDRYFDRGVRVCQRWRKFENFLADMGEKPQGMSLDRKNNNGNYSPKNCRWATPLQQANNKSNNRILRYRGMNYTMAELVRLSGHPYARFQMRIIAGWSVKDAVETPSMKR